VWYYKPATNNEHREAVFMDIKQLKEEIAQMARESADVRLLMWIYRILKESGQ
jgi:benzoyl-CoA reductase/2-hydroxyglutaryl-CoA dehydratase subunit BcrC/BadD/HgdB